MNSSFTVTSEPRMRSTAAASMLALCAWASTGCSFVYTKGPQPELHPPPPCTTSNVHATADLVLATASVAALVAGSIVYAQGATSDCSGLGNISCGVEKGAGIGAMVAGGIGTLVFVPSAIVGYNRTADCRAWLEANPQYAPEPAPPTPSSFLVPARRCPAAGDAPRICPAAPPLESSVFVLSEAPR